MLERRNIGVTGAGSGIGRATAVALAERISTGGAGEHLFLLGGRRERELEETRRMIADTLSSDRVVALSGDLFSDHSPTREATVEFAKHPDTVALVHAAAHIPPPGDETSKDSQVLCTRVMVDALKLRQPEDPMLFVNTGSIGGFLPMTEHAQRALPYQRMKSDQMNAGEDVRGELGQHGVSLVTLAPGLVSTDMVKELGDPSMQIRKTHVLLRALNRDQTASWRSNWGVEGNLQQDEALLPEDVGGAIATLVLQKEWADLGVPPYLQRWLMLTRNDLLKVEIPFGPVAQL